MREVRVGGRSRCYRRRHHEHQHPLQSNLPLTDDALQVAALRAAAARACAETEPFSLRFEAIFPSPDALVAVGDYGGCGCGCDEHGSNDDAKTLPMLFSSSHQLGAQALPHIHSAAPFAPIVQVRATAAELCNLLSYCHFFPVFVAAIVIIVEASYYVASLSFTTTTTICNTASL